MSRGNKRAARHFDGRQVSLKLTSEQSEYFNACARMRNLSFSALIRRLLETIAQDTLSTSILDDGCAVEKTPHEYRWRQPGRGVEA